MRTVSIAGIPVRQYFDEPGWIPPVELVLTPTTRRNLQKLLYPLNSGQNLLLVGDAGVGKNALIYYINRLRNHPTVRYSFNEDTLPDDLVGAYKIDPRTHSFVWSDGPLSSALRTGSVFVADEMNLAPPEVLKRFSSVFTERSLQLLEGDASVIQAAPGFSFIATQNPAEGFEGRKNLPREIQKYFATVYVDAYPEQELVDILHGLRPELPVPLLESLVRINNRVEGLVLQRKVGARDLERYHFNLRNLARLAKRLNENGDVLSEVRDIYVSPFRSTEDRKMVDELVADELGNLAEGSVAYSVPVTDAPLQIQLGTSDGSIAIGRAQLQGAVHEFRTRVEAALRAFPPVPARRTLLEAMARAVECGENVLLESHPDVEPEDYVAFFAMLLGRPLTTITLSRGMHTADILGGLKPSAGGSTDANARAADTVGWVDGPLTAAVRRGDLILLKGLEAAGPELVEKLNMLTDDARALVLPPESGVVEPLVLHPGARVFGIKYFRTQRSTPSISRAFRNRFSAFVASPITDEESLREIVGGRLDVEPDGEVARVITTFHRLLREKAAKREIGAENLQPYQFGLTNLLRLCDHLSEAWSADREPETPAETMVRAAGIAYVNEVADPVERERAIELLRKLLGNVELETELDAAREARKKKEIKHRTYDRKIAWDQQAHFRKPNTGKAQFKINGQPLKKGIDINTPETGGNTKEGPDAWYGSDTQGNKGQGEPGAGGGSWGYRTEELYEAFLKKRKILWDYNVGVDLKDFQELFGAEIERVAIDFDRLLDPRIDIHRRYMMQGSRLDARRYLSYVAGRGDGRVFDKTSVTVEDDRLKGVEIVIALNKGRRIFNFEYSVATLVAIMSLTIILNNHEIPCAVAGFSDLKNDKRTIDINWFKEMTMAYGPEQEEQLFYGLARDWFGDTVPEAQVLDELVNHFTPSARTRILVMLSDFRGARGKVTMEKDVGSDDTYNLKLGVERLTKQGVILLGTGVGPRAIADLVFPESLQIAGEAFPHLPALLAGRVTDLIHRHHNAAIL